MTRNPDTRAAVPPAARGSANPDADPAGTSPSPEVPAQTSASPAPQLPGDADPSPAGVPTPRAGGTPAGSTAIAAAMSEDRGPDSLDAHVRKLIADLGLRGYHTHDARRSAAGYPDWTIVGPHGVLFRELKRQSGKVSPEQEAWLEALRLAGQDACVWRPSHLLNGSIARELAAISGLRVAGGAA